MTVAPFKPKGELPEWRLLYDTLLEPADFGTLITYAELDAALGRRFADNRGPLYRANRQLGELRRRQLVAVPGIGYRVIDAREHIMEAQRRKLRGQRQLHAMVRVADFTDIAHLTPEELQRFDSQATLNRKLCQIITYHEARLNRIEDVLHQAGLL